MAQALNNDVIVHRWDALAIFKQFTRSTTGTPASLVLAEGGYVQLGLEATAESEAHRVAYGAGAYRAEDLQWAKFRVACSEDLGENTQIAVGLAGSPQDNPDNNAAGVWAVVLPDNTIVIESDDGVTDVDDIPTGTSLGLHFRDIVFNFRDGMFRGDVRQGGNQGGHMAVLPSIENSHGVLRPVARSTQFTLAGATSPLQPFAQIIKASSTDWGHLFVKEIELAVRRGPITAAQPTTTTAAPTTTTG